MEFEVDATISAERKPLQPPRPESLCVIFRRRQPVMVFTCGAPGAGKTYTLDKLYGLDSMEMLDLDSVIPDHPEYDDARPAALYACGDAYRWANRAVERNFQQLLRRPRHDTGKGRFVCFDGTGTHVERQIRKKRRRRANTASISLLEEASAFCPRDDGGDF